MISDVGIWSYKSEVRRSQYKIKPTGRNYR